MACTPCLHRGAPHRHVMPPMPPLTPEQLFARLDALGIAHRTYTHPPVFTVAEAAALRGSLPGGHCKSLFLKDRKGGLWLVVMLEERRIDLKKLADALGAPRFSFGSAELLCRGARRHAGQRDAVRAGQRYRAPRRRRCSTRGCWSTTRSTIIRSTNDRTTAIAPARSAALYRRLRARAAHRRSRAISSVAPRRDPGGHAKLRRTVRPERLSSRRAAAMFAWNLREKDAWRMNL